MAEQLKNMFFTSDSLSEFADILLKNHPEFAKDTFLAAFTVPEWKSLELKEKMRFTTEVLRPLLPDSYEKAVSILEQAAPYVKGFEAITLPDFVEVYGMDEWDLSMHALRVFTRYSSSEFAIRPFLRCDLEKAMTFMYSCAEDEHEKCSTIRQRRVPSTPAVGDSSPRSEKRPVPYSSDPGYAER